VWTRHAPLHQVNEHGPLDVKPLRGNDGDDAVNGDGSNVDDRLEAFDTSKYPVVNAWKVGSAVGEDCLFYTPDAGTPPRWKTSAVASSKSTLLVMSAQFFQQAVACIPALHDALWEHHRRIQQHRGILSSVWALVGLSEASLRFLGSLLEVQRLMDGHTLCQEPHDGCKQLCVVVSGQVLLKSWRATSEGQVRNLRRILS
jgi:CRP-like cAMP-binding protein